MNNQAPESKQSRLQVGSIGIVTTRRLDAQCKIDPKLDRCYGLTPEEIRNIVGSGREITEINTRPWLDHLQKITDGDPIRCVTVMLTDSKVQSLPPSKIPAASLKLIFSRTR
jgi:hypothetical protein